MKNHLRIVLAILIAAGLVSCVEQGGLKAGAATGKSMLQLIPANCRAVFMIDVHRALTTDAAAKALKDGKMKQKYDDFVKMAGLDPMKDVYYLAVGVTRAPAATDREGAIVLNLRYQKEQLLAKLKEAAKNLREETYNGLTIYTSLDAAKPGKMAPAGAFLDDSNIVIGNDKTVRAVIDVFQKKADSVLKNAEMGKVLKAVNTSAVVWGAIIVPSDMIKKAAEQNPMLKPLEGVTGLAMSFDYVNMSLIAEVQSLGGTKEQNKQLADTLNGLKAMGSAAASKEPVLLDLLNTLEITSGADHVKLYAAVRSELLEKVQKMAQEKLGGMVSFGTPSPKEEKKEEKKAEPGIKK
ncbi:MAG: DUF3352 domain-containing protein [Candidatus Aminicenantales bacterium]